MSSRFHLCKPPFNKLWPSTEILDLQKPFLHVSKGLSSFRSLSSSIKKIEFLTTKTTNISQKNKFCIIPDIQPAMISVDSNLNPCSKDPEIESPSVIHLNQLLAVALSDIRVEENPRVDSKGGLLLFIFLKIMNHECNVIVKRLFLLNLYIPTVDTVRTN